MNQDITIEICNETKKVKIKQRFRQGCTLSLLLLNLFIEKATHKSLKTKQILNNYKEELKITVKEF